MTASRKPKKEAAEFPGRWTASGTILCCLFAAQSAAAQGLRDPMQPPSFVSGNAPTAAAGVDSAAHGLQLVKTSRDRREATIDGKIVRVGEKVGEAILLEISDSAAILRGPAGERITLYLFPDVDKRIVKLTRPIK